MNANFVIFETTGKQHTVVLFSRGALSKSSGALRLWTRTHDGASEHALSVLDALLAEAAMVRADLSAVAFGQGPGGFTGLRVACGLAQGLAFALEIPVIPIPSLLAAAAHDAGEAAPPTSCAWVVMQDARMAEVYAAVHAFDARAQRWQTLHPPSLIGVESVPDWLLSVRDRWVDAQANPLALRAVGNALNAYPSLAGLPLFDSVGSTDCPNAHTLARLALQAWDRGETLPPDLAAPLYVRDKIAYTTRERTQGLGGNPKADGVVHAAPPSVIVPMTADHLPQVVEIERSVQSFPWTLGNFHDALQSGYGAWVVTCSDKVQGFCVVMYAPDVAHLLVIAVARDSQRRGVGRWLMHHAQQHVQRKGLAALILEVRPSNQAARAFYQHLGFEPLSVRKDYYPAGRHQREDAWVLRKSLASRAQADKT